MSKIEFVDYTEKIKGVLDDLAYKALEEVSGELEAQVKRNTPVGKVNGGGLKNSWQHNVVKKDEGYVATVGSPLERALWVEFGTGEYAIPESGKSGRKGGWYIPVGSGEGHISEQVAKRYGMSIRNGKEGKKWVFTLGMKPKRPLFKAYSTKKNKLINHIKRVIQGGLS